jgi:hypothetical protein
MMAMRSRVSSASRYREKNRRADYHLYDLNLSTNGNDRCIAGGSSGVHCRVQRRLGTNGTLMNKERFFWLHVPDWEDDAGAESVCYARENKMLVATRWGVQVCADDGPTQVILPMPDRSRVMGVCLGGPDLDTLFAFCGDKVWKRAVKIHGIGAFSPWTKTGGNPL